MTNYKLSSLGSEQGVIAIMFGLLIIPFILAAALTIEFSRVFLSDTEIAYALDSAAIATARYGVSSGMGIKIFNANMKYNSGGLVLTPILTVSSDDTTFSYSASGQLPLYFSNFVGINFLKVSGYSQVTKVYNNVELALVLDNTGSMAENGKIQGLRAAATQLVNIVFQNQATSPYVAVSIVPYVAAVNIGTNNAAWLKDLTSYSYPTDTPWSGCVGALDTGSTMGTDAPPSSSRKWPTYFAATTYTAGSSIQGNNDWTTNGGLLTVKTPISGVNIGPNRNCGLAIQPLTNIRLPLLNKISAMTPINGGGTFGDQGLNWGWNTISPNWKGFWGLIDPKSYTAANNFKYIVIVTDGQNQWYAQPGYVPVGDPTAFGYAHPKQSGGNLADNLLGTTNINDARALIDKRLLSLCSSIKANNIQIFTVTFRVSDAQAKNIYQQCASGISNAFEAEDSTQLYNIFTAIGDITQSVRIVK